MAKNTSIILGEHYDKFIQEELADGVYASASEMIREGLRLLQEKRKKIDAINKALVVGENSGKPLVYNHKEFLKAMAKKHGGKI